MGLKLVRLDIFHLVCSIQRALLLLLSLLLLQATSKAQNAADMKPKSMTRPKVWSEEVEEAYRFQLAGYRDEREYLTVKKMEVLHKTACV